jgi:hypothetical protein
VQRNRSFVVGDRTIANQPVIDNPQLELLPDPPKSIDKLRV